MSRGTPWLTGSRHGLTHGAALKAAGRRVEAREKEREAALKRRCKQAARAAWESRQRAQRMLVRAEAAHRRVGVGEDDRQIEVDAEVADCRRAVERAHRHAQRAARAGREIEVRRAEREAGEAERAADDAARHKVAAVRAAGR